MDELAGLMKEFALEEGELKGEGWRVALKRPSRSNGSMPLSNAESGDYSDAPAEQSIQQAAINAIIEEKPKGTPVNSPMTGIYYTAASPSAPPFVKEGEVVEAGQVVGLIEAMKVFNEIVAPIAGTVTEISMDNGALVQPGDALLYIA